MRTTSDTTHNADFSLRLSWALLIAALGVGLLLKLGFDEGFGSPDAWRYLKFSRYYLHLEPFIERDHAASRLAFLIPTGLMGMLLGDTPQDYALAQILLSQLNIVLVYLLTVQMSGRRNAGVMAAAIMAVTAREAYNLIFLPDTILLTYILTFFLFWLHAEKGGRRAALLYFLAGISIGLAYSAKEPGLLLAPFVGVWTIAHHWREPRAILRKGLLLAGGLVVYTSVDWFVLWLYTGDPWFKIFSIQLHNKSISRLDLLSWPNAWKHIRLQFKFLTGQNYGTGILAALGVPCTLFLASAAGGLNTGARRAFRAWALWGLFIGTYLTLGTSSLSQYILPPIFSRYSNIFVVVGFSAIAMALLRVPVRWRAWTTALVLCIQLGLSAQSLAKRHVNAPRQTLCLIDEAEILVGLQSQTRARSRLHEAKRNDVALWQPGAPMPPPYLLITWLDRGDYKDKFSSDKLYNNQGKFIATGKVEGVSTETLYEKSCAMSLRDKLNRTFYNRGYQRNLHSYRWYRWQPNERTPKYIEQK